MDTASGLSAEPGTSVPVAPGAEILGRIAIVGGTGVGEFELETKPETMAVHTPWGETVAQIGMLKGRETIFLPRHGAGHRIPPHRINYRANIAALKMLGARAILATSAVGGLRPDLPPGTLLILDDLIDFTLGRTGKTFFDGQPGAPVVHTDLTRPYSEPLRAALLDAASSLKLSVGEKGTYLCADGPRYETAAEVRLFASWGADVAGMTGVPEATLAREAGLHYASVALITNAGAGLVSGAVLTHSEVEEAMNAATPRLRQLLTEAVGRIDPSTLPAIGPAVPLPIM